MARHPLFPDPSGHILVASPNPAIRERLLRSLSSSNLNVEQASGGAEALARLESGMWQTLLLDRRLPDLDADELTNTIRHQFPSVRVVMLDAHSEPEASSRGLMSSGIRRR